MANKKTTRVKSPAVDAAPQTRQQVISSIADIGVHTRERQRIEAAMNDELAQVREKWETQAQEHSAEIVRLSAGVQSWCEANRVELTQGGKTKTVAFASGEVKWRMRPPSVGLRKVDDVIEALHSLGLEEFIRTSEEVNKDAILADPEREIRSRHRRPLPQTAARGDPRCEEAPAPRRRDVSRAAGTRRRAPLGERSRSARAPRGAARIRAARRRARTHQAEHAAWRTGERARGNRGDGRQGRRDPGRGKRDWNYAHALAEKMFGTHRVEWLHADQLHKLVAALMIDQKRRRAKAAK
jgi:phage host-nuclease inhibitor protein Gam